MEGGILLNGVVRESMAVFQLFSNGDEVLLVGWDPFLVPDLLFNIPDCVRDLDIKGDCPAGQGLHKDMRTYLVLSGIFYSIAWAQVLWMVDLTLRYHVNYLCTLGFDLERST